MLRDFKCWIITSVSLQVKTLKLSNHFYKLNLYYYPASGDLNPIEKWNQYNFTELSISWSVTLDAFTPYDSNVSLYALYTQHVVLIKIQRHTCMYTYRLHHGINIQKLKISRWIWLQKLSENHLAPLQYPTVIIHRSILSNKWMKSSMMRSSMMRSSLYNVISVTFCVYNIQHVVGSIIPIW